MATNTNKPSPPGAVLGNIEVEGVNRDGKQGKRSWYFVRIYVDNKEVMKSTKKPAASVLKWGWDVDNQIRFSPSSMMKIVLYRGFETDIKSFDHLVGQHKGNFVDLLDNGNSFELTDKKGIPVSVKMRIALSLVSESTSAPQDNANLAINGPSDGVVDPETRAQPAKERGGYVTPHDNTYLEIGGLPVDSKTGVQPAKSVGSVAYEGLKAVVDVLHDCSDAFPPLKTATAIFQKISTFVEAISENKQELKDLEAKLRAILSIVEKYKKDGGVEAITHRIEDFSKAITVQLEAVETLQEQSMLTRAASAQKDADTILKALRNIISLCDIFQIDTHLNIDITVGKVLEYMNSGLIDKLNHPMTSYKTRMSSYGDPTGCMEGTRVKVLEDLDAWAADPTGSKVYWMAGMAGIGKSTIAHTFCQILEAKNMLSGSFFASRAADKTSNARLIIPVIAHALARSSPPIKVKVVKAIEDDSTLAEPTYSNMREQFKQLVYDPIQTTAGMQNKPYKVVVIDAVDECSNLEVVASFIKLVVQSALKIPLKVFISSREEFEISDAFYAPSDEAKHFRLHDIEKDVVQEDIRRYLETSLANIRDKNRHGTGEAWPSQSELNGLIMRCGTLFIYAATALRYIASGGRRYKSRLSEMAQEGLESVTEFKTDIDILYIHILEMTCKEKRSHEVTRLRDIVSIIIFLCNPLPMQAIESLSEMDASSELSSLASVIHLPDGEEAPVAPFHASFPDFITNPSRCSPDHSLFRALDASEGHQLLALKCLKLMNQSLRYNICKIPEELIPSHRERKNSPDNAGKISAAVKYSCIYWASHLAEVKKFDNKLTDALGIFLHEHLLHWIECLSMLGELQTALKSLSSIATVLLGFRYNDLWLLVNDARQCLQMNFEAVQKHCMEIYQSALVWLPKKSLIRKTYKANVCKFVPKVSLGLPNWWDATELVIQNRSFVTSVAFSPNSSQVVSGSEDKKVRIWNVTTGEMEAELKGHTGWVWSVAFSSDGSQIVSGSDDKTIRIWNVTTGEMEAELKGHTDAVRSVAFSQDSSQVVSGSADQTVCIWNVMTKEIEVELKGHTDSVRSVAFSQDGSQVVSGSYDKTVLIWNVATEQVEVQLKGHTDHVWFVAFSQDGSQVISGSADQTARIWNVSTGEAVVELKGHTSAVMSVAFSQDGRQVVSGSDDKTVCIWDVRTGKVEAVLKGHTDWVWCVAFSQDGSQVASGSGDSTVRIWNVGTGQREAEQAELKGHIDSVRSVAFSPDGSQVVSGSKDHTIWIWNVTTGEVEAQLNGHTDQVWSVAFSKDGRRIVSGSRDKTIRIWNVRTGEVEAQLTGHTDHVLSVAFSQDGSQVISGSADRTLRIWNVTTGEAEAQLNGHRYSVNSVAFSLDGSQVVSGSSLDKTVRIWDVTTGHSQLMTNSDVILADGGRVTRAGTSHSHEFHIFYPLQQPTLSMPLHSAIQISSDDQWVMATFCHCWIPTQYRSISCSSIYGSRICLGYQSGHVLVLDLTVA